VLLRRAISGHSERARIFEELKELYAKALGPSWQRNELVASINAGSIERAVSQGEDDDESINEPPRNFRMDEPLQSLARRPTDQDEMGGPMAPEVLIPAAPKSLERLAVCGKTRLFAAISLGRLSRYQ
jgi:hypothetical protein